MILPRRVFLLTAVPFAAGIAGCGGSKSGEGPHYPEDQSRKVTIAQGVWGQVWFWSGNFQPGSLSGTVTAVKRAVYLFAPTYLNQLTPVTGQDGLFYNKPTTTLIAQVDSDDTGFFQAPLVAGNYSLFVQENGAYYCSSVDGNGQAFPLTVTANAQTKAQVDIAYQAAF